MFKVFGIILRVYLVFGKKLNWFGNFCMPFGKIFIAAIDQILKNNLTKWSHWVSHQK